MCKLRTRLCRKVEMKSNVKLNTSGKHKEDGTSDTESFLNYCNDYIVKTHGTSSDASSDITDNDGSTTADCKRPASRLKPKGKENRNYKRVKRRGVPLDLSDNHEGGYRNTAAQVKTKGKRNGNYKRIRRRRLDSSDSSSVVSDNNKENSKVESGNTENDGHEDKQIEKRGRNKRIERRSSSVSGDDEKGNSRIIDSARSSRDIEPMRNGDKELNHNGELHTTSGSSSDGGDDDDDGVEAAAATSSKKTRSSRDVEPGDKGKGDKELNHNGELHTTSGSSSDGGDDDDGVEAAAATSSKKTRSSRDVELMRKGDKELNHNGELHTTSGSSSDGGVEAAAATSSKKTGTSLNKTSKDEAKCVYFSGESSTGDPDIGVAYLQMKIQQSIDEGNHHRESLSDETSVFSSSSDGRELSRMCADFRLMDEGARNRRVIEFLNKWCPCDEENKGLTERIEQAKSKRKSVGATLENIVSNSPKLYGREAREIEVDLGVFQRRRASRRKREAELFNHFLSKLKDDKKGTAKRVGNKRKRKDVRAPDCENGRKSTKRLRGGKRRRVSDVSLEREPQPEKDCAGSSTANGESSTFPFRQSRKLYSSEAWLCSPTFLALHQDK